jgi:hypothetical protein
MGRLLPLLALADLALIVIALIDCLSAEEHQIRALPRVVWVFLILLFSPIGGIAWFVAGRPEPDAALAPATPTPASRRQTGVSEPAPRRELAPDDDPEFLAQLAARSRRQEEERLRAWEADLRRREEELRRGQRDEPEDPKP